MSQKASDAAWNNLVDHSHPGGMPSGSSLHKQAALVCHFTNVIEADGASSYFESCIEVGTNELRAALHAIGATRLAAGLDAFVDQLGEELPPHRTDRERLAFLDQHLPAAEAALEHLGRPEQIQEALEALRRHVAQNVSFYVSLSTQDDLAFDQFVAMAVETTENDALPEFRDAAIAERVLASFRLWGVRGFFERNPGLGPEDALQAIRAVGATRTAETLERHWGRLEPPLGAQLRTRIAPRLAIRRDELDLGFPEYGPCYQELEGCLRRHAATYRDFYRDGRTGLSDSA